MENKEKEIKETGEKEFSLLVFIRLLLKNWLPILLVTVICAGAIGFYTHKTVKPQYTSTVTFFAEVNYSKMGAGTAQTTYAYSVGSQIANNVVELITTDGAIRNAVKKTPGMLDNLGVETDSQAVNAIKRTVSVSKTSEDTCLFTLKVTTADKSLSFFLANALQSTVPEYISDEVTEYANLKVVGAPQEDTVVVTSAPVARNAVIGGAAGFALSVLFFVILYFLDTLIYDEQNVKDNFSYPIIGTIPSWNGKQNKKVRFAFLRHKKTRNAMRDPINRDYKGKLLGPDAPFGVTEAFNMLRTNVSYAKAANGSPVYAVTSAFSGAGKSTVSTNLAISVAMLGKKTLLIECDMRCPSFRHIFGLKKEHNQKGLSDLLAGLVSDPHEAVRASGTANLDCIFAGHLPPNPSELLAGEKMKELCDAFAAEYDCIILDMPPICEVADAGVVAPIITGYLVTVRSGYSDIGAVRAAISLLNGVGGNILGIVLNDIDPKTRSSYRYSKGYYYYSSGDRYGKSQEEANAEENGETK